MRPLRTIIVIGALSAVVAGLALAQTPPTQPPAKPTQPPATPPAQPPATQPPAAQPTPPKPYPEGAKIAYIDLPTVAASSVDGKAASAKLQLLNKKKVEEIQEKNKKLEELRSKAQTTTSVISDQARQQLEKEIDKLQRDIQYAQQEAQSEMQQLEAELQAEFQRKLNPILQQISQEKSLHLLIDIRNSGAVWVEPGLDLSQEVIKRLDAATKTPAKK